MNNFIKFPSDANIENAQRIKFGIDPTSDRLHLGHFACLRLFKQFIEMGKDCTLVLGTFTASLGDPSGKNKTRPIIKKEVVVRNANKILSFLEEGFLKDKEFKVLFNEEIISKTYCNRII